MQAKSARRFGRVLLTNDDGIDAPGLAVLAELAEAVADEVWIVAPEHDQSGTSRSVSLHAPLRLHRRGERLFAVSGTPSDCVILALRHLMAETPPDIVLSGVNRGANIGHEIAYSGTVSAALTARMLGVPGLALSQAFRDREHVRWDTARALGPRVFDWLEKAGAPGDWPVFNVNFPDVPAAEVAGHEFTRQGAGTILTVETDARQDARGLDYFWLSFRRSPGGQEEGTDIAALRRRAVAITPVGFDLTDDAALARLAV